MQHIQRQIHLLKVCNLQRKYKAPRAISYPEISNNAQHAILKWRCGGLAPPPNIDLTSTTKITEPILRQESQVGVCKKLTATEMQYQKAGWCETHFMMCFVCI